jgi:hypothetical protein
MIKIYRYIPGEKTAEEVETGKKLPLKNLLLACGCDCAEFIKRSKVDIDEMKLHFMRCMICGRIKQAIAPTAISMLAQEKQPLINRFCMSCGVDLAEISNLTGAKLRRTVCRRCLKILCSNCFNHGTCYSGRGPNHSLT